MLHAATTSAAAASGLDTIIGGSMLPTAKPCGGCGRLKALRHERAAQHVHWARAQRTGEGETRGGGEDETE
jgi:hypothetical protein